MNVTELLRRRLVKIGNIYLLKIIIINMETSLKTGFAQIFSCCPKNLSCPNFGGVAAPLAPPGPYAYVSFVASLAFVIFLSLEMMRHFMVQATFDSDCNLMGLKTLEKNGNKFSFFKNPDPFLHRKDKQHKEHLYLRAKRNSLPRRRS